MSSRKGYRGLYPHTDKEVHDGSNTGGLDDAVYDADGNVEQLAT
jgi:hypothetical protein